MLGSQESLKLDMTPNPAALGAPRRTRQSTRFLLYLRLIATDCVALIVGLALPGLISGTLWSPYSGLDGVSMLLLLYCVFAINDGAYTIDVFRSPLEGIGRALKALAFGILAILMVAFFLKSGAKISRLTFGLGVATSGVLICGGRVLFHRHVRKVTRGHFINELYILDGVPLTLDTSAVVIDAARLKLEPDANNPRMLQQFGILTKGFDRVVIDCDASRRSAWALLLKGADIDGELLIAQFNEIGAIAIDAFEGLDTVLVSRRALSVAERAKKRTIDLVFAIPILIALSPLLALVAIAIKLETRGPVLFKQDRVGRGNRLFKILKFRSMRVEQSDSAGTRSTQRDDDRITRVGKIIRMTSIDELPQLINVLLGEMSLVGPRPHALGSLAGERLFWEVDNTYWHRHRLKPGITGLAQIRGYRGATHASQDLTNRLQADLEYIEGWSIWRDVSILFNTFRVLVHRNAY